MLSLSMIVRDEEEQLAGCLESVRGFVQEMVVVDTGSRDGTVAVAERCGAVVHHLPWPGDFAPARNHALGLVRGDWVLVLDADERLRPEARAPLRILMEEPTTLVINLLRREEGAASSPYSSVSRLFRRHPALHWSRAYHASIDDSVIALLGAEPRWRVVSCDEPALLHSGYRPERLAGGEKAARLRRAMEEELRRRPDDPYACAKLGALEVSEGRAGRGIDLLRRGLGSCPPQAHAERYELLLHLAIALARQDPGRAEALYRQALTVPLDPRLTLAARLNLAALLLGRGATAEAAALARRATALDPRLAMAWYDLGLIERRRGHLEAAIEAYRRAIELAPGHAEAHQNLAAALLLAGDIAGARRGFRQAIDLLRRQDRPAEAMDLERRAGAVVKLEP
ncbi:MAG: glycosyltransferase [Synechococcaceae cyanobacterium]|nr:glycosyltransferase [Synechococcaceae cyanobacterium]